MSGGTPVAANERRVRHGGLYRCCLATIGETASPSDVGTVLDCTWETPGNANMIVAADGVWEWNRA